MSQPNPTAEKEEWLNTRMDIMITVHGSTLENTYFIENGQVPEQLRESIQSTVDTLLDTSEL